MKIPKKQNKITFSTRLKPSVIDLLKYQSKKDNVSIAQTLEFIIEKSVKMSKD